MNDHSQAPRGEGLPELPLAYEYVYGWSGGHRSLSSDRWNGMPPDTSETVYRRDQMHAYALTHAANLRAEVERLNRELAKARGYAEKLLNSELSAIADRNRLRAELEALRATRAAEVDRVMELASKWVLAERAYVRGNVSGEVCDAAREALRTAQEAKS